MDAAVAARRWADAWKRGWESLDPEPILACYAAEAVLSTEPFREPYRGRDGVRSYVERVLGEEEDPRVWMAEPIVEGQRAVVSWWASLVDDGAETTLAGTSVLVFDADGLVIEQWDAWNQAPRRVSPPPTTSAPSPVADRGRGADRSGTHSLARGREAFRVWTISHLEAAPRFICSVRGTQRSMSCRPART